LWVKVSGYATAKADGKTVSGGRGGPDGKKIDHRQLRARARLQGIG
jgi:hypothetical protein